MSSLGGSIIGAAGNLIGGLFGMGSNISANKTNLQAVRETNEANMQINQANIDAAKAMYDRQENFNREIYEDNKKYNSAVEQRKRLEEAGLNPYLMMNGGSAGTATSASAPGYSQPQQIPMQAGRVQPVLSGSEMQSIVNGMNEGALVAAQARKLNKEADILGVQSDYAEMETVLRGIETLNRIKGISYDNRMKLIDTYVKQNTADYSIEAAKLDNDYKFNQVRSSGLDILTKEAQLPYVSQLAQLQVDKLAADILLTKKQKQLVDAQIGTEMVKPSLYAQQIALMVQQGELSVKQAQEAYSRTLLNNKTRLNMPNLSKAQADELAACLVESAQNALIIQAPEVGRASTYINSGEGFQKALDFFGLSNRAIVPLIK